MDPSIEVLTRAFIVLVLAVLPLPHSVTAAHDYSVTIVGFSQSRKQQSFIIPVKHRHVLRLVNPSLPRTKYMCFAACVSR